MKKLMVARDCQIKIDDNNKINVYNTMFKGGKVSTFDPEKAIACLNQIVAFGDEIPFGCVKELESLK